MAKENTNNEALYGIENLLKNLSNAGNKRASNKDDFEAAGMAVGYHADWKTNIEDILHPACEAYFKAGMYRIPQASELQPLRNKVFTALNRVYGRAGLGRATEFDFEQIIGYIKRHMTAGVSFYGITGKQVFRKYIEIYLGIKLNERAVIGADNADAVKAYQSAVKAIDNAEETIAALQAIINKNKNKITKRTSKEAKAIYETIIEEAETEKKAAEDRKAKAELRKKETEATYAAVMLELKGIRAEEKKTA